MDGTLELQDQAAIGKPEEINRLLVEAGFPPSNIESGRISLGGIFPPTGEDRGEPLCVTLPGNSGVEFRRAVRLRMPLVDLAGIPLPSNCHRLPALCCQEPDLSTSSDWSGEKANLVAYSSADWGWAYFRLLPRWFQPGCFILLVISISWVFGREFTDGTVKDLLAVPVRRSSILLAKFILIAAWALPAHPGGHRLGFPDGSVAPVCLADRLLFFWRAAAGFCSPLVLLLLVVFPFAFFASAGRGYLLPLGLAVLALFNGQPGSSARLG